MNLQNPRRSELTGFPYLNNALDFILTRINALWAVEHHDDGTHGAVTADSVTVTGDVTTEGDGTFTGDVIAQSGDSANQVEIGEVTTGTSPNGDVGGIRMGDWVCGVRPAQSPAVSGTEMVLFYVTRSGTVPALRLVDDTTNVILALNSTFTALRGIQVGEDASGKRLAAIYSINHKLTGTWTLQGSEVLSGVITPTQITGDQNDYAPTDILTARILRVSTDASRNITGLTNVTNGNVLTIWNVGAFDVVLVHASGSSTAAMQFACPGAANVTLSPNDSVDLWYDATTARWRVQGL